MVVSVMSGFDLERYRKFMTGVDLPDADKDEMIRIVWSIMQNFVDRAWHVDAVQLAFASASSGYTEEKACDTMPASAHDNQDDGPAGAPAGPE